METENTTTTPGKAPRNLLQEAAAQQAAFSRGMLELSGYKTITTFFADLTIAEAFGPDGVRETFARVCKEWRHDYRYFTEFILCLNHKIWQHYQSNEPLARAYNDLWAEADRWALDNWTGEAAEYYYAVTD